MLTPTLWTAGAAYEVATAKLIEPLMSKIRQAANAGEFEVKLSLPPGHEFELKWLRDKGYTVETLTQTARTAIEYSVSWRTVGGLPGPSVNPPPKNP